MVFLLDKTGGHDKPIKAGREARTKDWQEKKIGGVSHKKSADSLGDNERITYLCIPIRKMGIGLCLNASESNYSHTITIWWINPPKRSLKQFAVPALW